MTYEQDLAGHELAQQQCLTYSSPRPRLRPVDARVQGWDATCTELFDSVMTWPDDNNTYGTKSLTIPSGTDTVRFTFFNDFFAGTQDTDRNLFLDEWDINGGTATQGEDFTRTDGTDVNFPGCENISIFGADVMACGNENDWVEYGPPCPESSCSDGVDNNNDGLTDCEDAGCNGVGSCEFGAELTCNDSIDNDGDVDCADADCIGGRSRNGSDALA